MRETTEKEIESLKSEGKKILVDFFADWCGPCKQLIPMLKDIGKSYDDIEFLSIDVDKNKKYSTDLGIRSIPTVMIFNGNELINSSTGIKPPNYYKELLNKL